MRTAAILLASLLVLTVSVAARGPAGDSASADGGEAVLDLKDPRHVRALYLDTLGRTPTADELELASAGRLSTLLRLLCKKDEFWEQWYEEELYYFLLVDNFRPDDPLDGPTVPERLADGEIHVFDAVRSLTSGSAFHRANPGNDTFVSVVFEQLLGMQVQDEVALLEAGKRMYDGERASLWGMEGRSQADVVRIACAQDAFAELFVRRQYQRVVGRTPPRRELRRWAKELREAPDDFPDLVREWLGSPAYAGRLAVLRKKSDRQFIRGLYVDLTGAPPTLESMQRHRTALAAVADSGPLRSVIARVLLESAGSGYPPRRDPVDAPPLVEAVFRRFLGREPGPVELEAFALAYEQCDCEPDILVRAVTTHQEYQYY